MEYIGATLSEMAILASASEVVVYRPGRKAQDAQLSLELKAHRPIEEKAVVCALYAFDTEGASVDLVGSSWPRSAKLDAPYQYLPRMDGSVRLDLKPFLSDAKFSVLLVALFPWGQASGDNDVEFGECYAGSKVVLDGKPFLAFNSLDRLESVND